MRIRPKKIISAIDFSNFTDAILAYSSSLCKIYSAKLVLAHVTIDVNRLLEHNETTIDAQALQKSNIRHAQARLEDLAKDLVIETEIIIGQGRPADEISRLALKQDADMVITGTYGRTGFKRLLIGSVTEKLMKTLHCPLLILHAQEHGAGSSTGFEIRLRKILVGCDFSPDSKLALDYGLSLAQEFQAELHLAHAIKPSLYQKERQEMDALCDRLDGQLKTMVPEACRDIFTPVTQLLDGEPYLALMNYATQQDIDLIVLGIRGHTLWEKLLVGSTTDRLIRHSSFPVLTVRQIEEQKTGVENQQSQKPSR